jgi:hypothetical protein
MCIDCVLASSRIADVDLGDEPLPEVVLSHCCHYCGISSSIIVLSSKHDPKTLSLPWFEIF